MADQHHEDAPAMGNQIASDIPDILESLKYHWDMLQMLLGVDVSTPANVSPPGDQRSKFSWTDADTIVIGPGAYFHDGSTRQMVFWDDDITFDLGSGGSNSASDDLDAGAQTIHYIYIDDSAVITQASPELDADCFLNTDVTAPTWEDAKHGWYNGSDRCIFAVLVDASNNVLEFLHDGGDFVLYADDVVTESALNPTNSFADITALAIPGFSTKATITVLYTMGDQATTFHWRTNGQSGSTGHIIAHVDSDTDDSLNTLDVITDSSQLIEVKEADAATANTAKIWTVGWHFPTGM